MILEVERPLQELMGTLAGTTQVISNGDPLPDFDFQCPLLSLPLAFGTRHETIPSVTPYLRAPVQALKNWQARLGSKTRPRIGLVWSGRPTHKNDQNRSIGLRTLIPLLDIEATLVSLQKDVVRTDDAAVLRDQSNLLHFGDALKNFSDTAALISNLDLVISVDTGVAHLAGALGKPVWILVTYIPDWRWLLDRDDSPWYPTARLFRQPRIDDWESVIVRVHEALRNFVESDGDDISSSFSDGTLTLSGDATAADYQLALDAVTVATTSDGDTLAAITASTAIIASDTPATETFTPTGVDNDASAMRPQAEPARHPQAALMFLDLAARCWGEGRTEDAVTAWRQAVRGIA